MLWLHRLKTLCTALTLANWTVYFRLREKQIEMQIENCFETNGIENKKNFNFNVRKFICGRAIPYIYHARLKVQNAQIKFEWTWLKGTIFKWQTSWKSERSLCVRNYRNGYVVRHLRDILDRWECYFFVL